MDSLWSYRLEWRSALDRALAWPEWAILIALAGVLRFFQLGSESLWFDEAFTARVVAPGTDFWRAVIGDDHPPLWSMIQWVNMRLLGNSEFAFRLPALVFSVGCVIMIWRIALALRLDRTTALVAGLTGAFLPASIYFGQDGRMYAALAFFLLLALWGTLTDHPLVVFISGGLAVYTQNAGVLYIIPLALAYLIPHWRYIRKQTFLKAFLPAWPFLGIALIWLPWLPQMLIQAGRVQQSFWQAGLNGINWAWPLLLDTFGWRAPDLVQIPLYGLAIVLTLVGLWKSRAWLIGFRGIGLIGMMIGGPTLLALYSILSGRSIYVYRPMLVTGLLTSILWAYALTHLRIENRLMLGIMLIAALIIGDISHYTNDRREDIPAFVAPIVTGWQAGDCIYYSNAAYAVLFGHYLPDKAYFVLPYHGNVMSITDEDQAAFNLPRMAATSLWYDKGCQRLWYLSILNPFSEKTELYENQALMAWPHTTITDNLEALSRDSIYLINAIPGATRAP